MATLAGYRKFSYSERVLEVDAKSGRFKESKYVGFGNSKNAKYIERTIRRLAVLEDIPRKALYNKEALKAAFETHKDALMPSQITALEQWINQNE